VAGCCEQGSEMQELSQFTAELFAAAAAGSYFLYFRRFFVLLS